MNMVDLPEAVVQIKQAYLGGKDPPHSSDGKNFPFFFIVGAGVSCPSVKLACDITRDCQQTAVSDREGLPLPDVPVPGAAPMDVYSYWMEKAYPHSQWRRDYIELLIRDKPISLANLRLAHVLGSRKLARIVVTPNFDDHLSRALRLFGYDFVTCDHPDTTARVSLAHDAPITILHVHGTHWFYDACNLEREIADRAENRSPSGGPDSPSSGGQASSSMAATLARILHESSPIVIGYSGWEHDVIMTSLRQRLGPHNSKLPYNLYWFCHSPEDANALPKWLSEHQSVVVVAPAQQPPADAPAITDDGNRMAKAEQMANAQEIRVITAQMVLDEILRGFGLAPPPLISDPLGATIDLLQKTVDFEQEQEGDIYTFGKVINDLKEAKKLLADSKISREKSVLDDVAGKMQQAKYTEALQLLASDAVLSKIGSAGTAQVVKWINVSLKGLPPAQGALPAYDHAVQILKNLQPLEHPAELRAALKLAHAEVLVTKAAALARLDSLQEAIAA